MGLAPESTQNSTSFIYALYNAGVLAEPIVGILISSTYNQSKIDFGNYNKAFLHTGDADDGFGLHWYQTINNDHWEIPLVNANYRMSSFLSMVSSSAIITTATQFIHIPVTDFLTLQVSL